MFCIYLHTILFCIFIGQSRGKFGINIHKEVVQISSKAWDYYKSARTPEEIVSSIRRLNETNSIKQREQYVEKTFHYLFKNMPSKLNLRNSLSKLDKTTTAINAIYDKFLTLTRLSRRSSVSYLANFVNNVTRGGEYDLEKLIKEFNQSIIRQFNSKTDIFSTLQKCFETDLGTCSLEQSPQDTVLAIYELLMLLEMELYIMLQCVFSYKEKGRMNELHSQHMKTVAEITSLVKHRFSSAPGYLWECDPVRHHVDGETYSRFIKSFTYLLVKQVETGQCRKPSGQYNFQPHPKCCGLLNWCQLSGRIIGICHADENSGRHYMNYKNLETSVTFGKQNLKCKRKNIEVVHSGMIDTGTRCDLLFCGCEYVEDSHRYISLIPVTSNIRSNKVITGIRYQKVNTVLYVQIQEGVLISDGSILPGSTKWKEIELVHFSKEHYTLTGLSGNREYYALHWHGRSFDLDELFVPPRSVLTGVAIFFYENGHMGFKIRATKFNFDQGILYDESSQWYQTKLNPNRKFPWSVHGIPTESTEQSTPVMDKNIFIPIWTSENVDDACQEAIPFIDLKPVKSFPPVPLVGLAVIFKRQQEHGGFLAWRAVTYNKYHHVFS